MEGKNINKNFIRGFFSIEDTVEGNLEADNIINMLIPLTYAHGQDIIVYGGEPDSMYFIESGNAVVLDADGREINRMHDGQFFGEYGVLTDQPRLSTVRALGKMTVFKMTKEDFMTVISRHPALYGDFMKGLYAQLSDKHSQVLELSRRNRGILMLPKNLQPMSWKKMLLNYGAVALVFILSFLLVPVSNSYVPAFVIPLVFMVIYVVLSRRTLETLIVAGMFSAVLMYRQELFGDYADALQVTMSDKGNAFTVLVMALMGGVVRLIEVSGATTAFRKRISRRVKTKLGVFLSMMGIMTLTGIDDGLNLATGTSCVNTAAKEARVPKEYMAVFGSCFPVVITSFIPMSLWGIFVLANLNVTLPETGVLVFCRAIPFFFFSIITVLAMVLLAFGKLPEFATLKKARLRVENGGKLAPEGSEKYAVESDDGIDGRIINLLLPVAVLAVSSLLLRTFVSRNFVLDSAAGLICTLVFMFFTYCGQKLISPEKFFEELVEGVKDMVLPILLYLLTMCFSTMLTGLSMEAWFDSAELALVRVAWLIPAMVFALATGLTAILGSSWAMFVIAFPIGVSISKMTGVNLELVIGAICSAGIAGEKICPYTAEGLLVGSSVGCNPNVVIKLRIGYSLIFAALSFLLYMIFGYFMV